MLFPIPEGGKDCGYFWMSYYEGSIMTPVSYQVDVGADDYDNLVQYDYLNIRSVYSTIGNRQNHSDDKGDNCRINLWPMSLPGLWTLSAVSFIAPAGCNVDIQIHRNGSPGK